MRQFISMAGACILLISGWLTKADAQSNIVIEVRRLPMACSQPLQCLPDSRLLLRNIASLNQSETRDVLSFLNRISAIRGLSDRDVDPLKTSKPPDFAKLHLISKSEKVDLLKAHPGVFFDTSVLDKNAVTYDFADYVQTQLSAIGVNFLTEDELEVTPGRPRLTVRFSPQRESEGCIIPFSVYMSITEETVLVRDAELKVEATIWSSTTRQNLANRNYTQTSALRETVEKFTVDWKAAHQDP